MTRLVVLLVLAAAAIGVAYLLQRRRPEPPSAPSYRAPAQVDRDDFIRPSVAGSLLLVVFASTTCSTCPAVWEIVSGRQRPGVDVERIDIQDDPDRHRRYKIDGVPTTLVVAADGVVRKSFFGPMTGDDLDSAL